MPRLDYLIGALFVDFIFGVVAGALFASERFRWFGGFVALFYGMARMGNFIDAEYITILDAVEVATMLLGGFTAYKIRHRINERKRKEREEMDNKNDKFLL